MGKRFTAMIVVLFLLAGGLPGVRSMTLPASPTAPATSSAVEVAQDVPPVPEPPAPDAFSPQVERARARIAIETVLDKHLAHWGPRDSVGALDVTLDGDWAHGVVRWSDASGTEGALHVLAQRSPDGVWQALMPSQTGLYWQWVTELPQTLVPERVKQHMRAQAGAVDAARSPRASDSSDAAEPSTPTSTDLANDQIQSMRDPAAVYCASLGYTYDIVSKNDGSQYGRCTVNERISCDAWDFFQGRCGQAYNVCARNGLETVTRTDGRNPFSQDYAVCVEADGSVVTSAMDAADLKKGAGYTPAYTATHAPAATDLSLATESRDLVIPAAFDWRNYNGANWMTPIKDQGICGSCWAFSAVGVAEAVTNIGFRNGALDPDMSEQYLVTDCAADAGDCAGGWGTSALRYVRDAGIPDEGCLPYHDGDPGGCTYNSEGCDDAMCTFCGDNECSDYRCSDRCGDWAGRLYSLARVNTVWGPSRDDIKAALLAHGPLAVSIYMGGGFDANDVYRCTDPPSTNHGVSIVGYNDAGGYWLVRNSWGASWNGDGYFKVAYDNCLIERYLTYADLVACDDPNELNDSADLATPLSFGQTIEAEICSSGDQDYYAFTGTAGDKIVVDIDAQSEGSSLDSYIYLLDSDGTTVLTQNDDEGSGSLDSHLAYELAHTGTYYVRVRDYSYDGGTDYAYSIHLLTDAVDPAAEIIAPQPVSWIDPGTQSILTDVSDGESGIRNVRFYWHDADWDNSDWVILADDWNPNDGWTYDLDTGSMAEQAQDCAVFIYAYDWAGNQTGYGVYDLGLDRTQPTVSVIVDLLYGDAPFRDFYVRWQDGYDNLSGIANYDVQMRDGAGGAWSDLTLATTETYTRFVGLDAHTYYFRVRARDNADNLSLYTTDEVSHTVDICAVAADAYEADGSVSSAAWITPDGYAQMRNFHVQEDVDWARFTARAGVTYTLSTGNTGDHADTVLELYDTDGSTLLATNDDCPHYWPASCLTWQPERDGTYYARLYHWDPWAYGCTTAYGLSLVSNQTPTLALGEPGTSFRYTGTWGWTEQAYVSDTQHLNAPNGLFIDSSDHLYVVEELGARMLKYRTADGASLLGIGRAGLQFLGEGTFDHPQDVAVDGGGNIWVVDRHRLAQYDAGGRFVQQFPAADPWQAGRDDAHFDSPRGIAFDSAGRMYVADSYNHRVQVYTLDVDGAPVYSTTIGVSGVPGDDDAHLDEPTQIVIDSSDRLYVTDVNNHRVQRCTYAGGWTCATFHGTGSAGGGADELNLAYGIGIDDGDNVYIADGGNGRVKTCDAAGVCSLFATGIDWPADVAVDAAGNVYVSDWYDHTVRQYDSGGTALGVLGTSGVPYLAGTGHFNAPYDVAVDGAGNIFVTEHMGYRLIKLDAAGVPLWAVGEAGVWGSDDAHFGRLWDLPAAVAVDGAGHAYVADAGNHRVQKCAPDGACSTFAGITGVPGVDDAHLDAPFGVTVDAGGKVYVADRDNHRVQKCTPDGACSTFAGVAGVPGSDNVHLNGPTGVAVDGSGYVYVADAWNRRVQKCAPDGGCITFAGVTGAWGEGLDRFWEPRDVAVDAQGRVYVADIYNQRVQVFDAEGAYLTTIGGQWGRNSGELRHAAGVVVDDEGNVYVADLLNARVQAFALGVPDWQQVNLNGFGERANASVSTLAAFGDQLYAGTYHSDAGAQLWRQGPDGAWSAVATEGWGDANNAAVDHLMVFKGQLYATTWNEAAGGQIWRSASGEPDDWQPVVAGGFDTASNSQVFRLAVFDEQIYAATWNPTTGGELWRSASGEGGTWHAVISGGLGDVANQVFVSLVEFDRYLYAATDNPDHGAQIWRSPTGDTGSWTLVADAGLGDVDNWSVTLAPFDGYLYAGTYNDGGAGDPGAELWRCQRCDGSDWEPAAIVKGWGDAGNRAIRSLTGFADALYALTDNRTTGMEVWRTVDGATWAQVGPDGLGDSNNASPYWDHSTAIFEDRLLVGTENPAHGGELWQSELQQARASFTASITSGVAPLTVTFANRSTGNYDTCLWRFGDGGSSEVCSDPSHTYMPERGTLLFPVDGVYSVTLTVSGTGGTDTLTRTHYITTYEPVRADFEASPVTGTTPLTVTFTNRSIGVYDICHWDFGDGTAVSEGTLMTGHSCVSATHVYTAGGVYTVSLMVDGRGGTDTLTRTNYITAYGTVRAEFGATPTSGAAPLTVDFTNLSVGDYDTCRWDLGDGAVSADCAGPRHTYVPAQGSLQLDEYVYTVTLAVEGKGGQDTETKNAYITMINRHSMYLPFVFKRWPPIPYRPVLGNVAAADYGDYIVSWTEHPIRESETYVLQEATNAAFTDHIREVCTTDQQSCAVAGQDPGVYYYRVRGWNSWGEGEWSAVQAVTVPDVKDKVSRVTVTLPHALASGGGNWCTWDWCSLSPRLYHAPLADGRTLVGWTDADGDGHVSVLGGDGTLAQTLDFYDRSVRGMVAHEDDTLAVLLWDAAAKIMWLSRRHMDGGEMWRANVDGELTSFNPGIGDSRLAYGDDMYAAYFAVHGDTGWVQGHEGDQLTYVSSDGVVQSGGWDWGCSHSMAELVHYHPDLEQFIAVCASDCYPGKGIFVNHREAQVYQGDGNCGGLVSTQLGQIVSGAGGWQLVFNALDRPCAEGRGIALATIDAGYRSSYVWLTHTDGQYERNPVIARLGSGSQSEYYLVGWKTADDDVYWLGVIDGAGHFMVGPEEVTSAGVRWGDRDDTFRTRPDGDVSWVQGAPNSSQLHLYRFENRAE